MAVRDVVGRLGGGQAMYRWFEGHGWGRVIQEGPHDTLSVAFFDGPECEEQLLTLPRASIRYPCPILPNVLDPLPQTRVYWQDPEDGIWKMGRVLRASTLTYTIRFPGKNDREISPSEIRIRWDRRIEDPSARLAQRLSETQFFLEHRRKFVRWLHEQRRCCLGMPALLSSCIDLEEHQIETAYTVLTDPIPRYLLADEVGLGKTIEAGIVIRQWLLDDPEDLKVAIVVPHHLIRQWTSELRTKFHLGCWIDSGQIRIESPECLNDGCPSNLGVLVVDEVHRVVADIECFHRLACWAENVDRLLLLSATPVLNNEAAFLRMLCLLDPEAYSADDLESFRLRVRNRGDIANVVDVLRGDAPVFVLRQTLAQASNLLAGDRYVQELIQCAEAAMNDPGGESRPHIEALAGYIAEIHRVHRRVIRHRRSALCEVLPSRAGVEPTLVLDDPGRDGLEEALDRWRDIVVGAVPKDEHADYGRQLAEMLQALDEHPMVLQRVIGGVLASEPALPGSGVLHGILRQVFDREDPKVEKLGEFLEECRDACLVFCGADESIDRVVLQLRRYAHLQHCVGSVADEDDVDAFVEPKGRVRVLVCGDSAENGLNLQGRRGVKVVHLTLPWEPIRIEQRIGRVDRYGPQLALTNGVFIASQSRYLQEWTMLLMEGMDVFRASLASVQHLARDTMEELHSRILTEGVDCLSRIRDQLTDGKLQRERQAVDRQDVLDEFGRRDGTGFDVDEPTARDARCLEDWAGKALGFQQKMIFPSSFRFKVDRKQTLLGLDRVTRFGNAIHAGEGLFQTAPMTLRRAGALKTGTGLARIGHPFVDALAADVRRDDRGMVAATWRVNRDYLVREPPFDVFFRVDLAVEVAPTLDGNEVRNLAALTRRADALFPPLYLTVYLDESLQEVTGTPCCGIIDKEYRHTRDTKIEGERWQHVDRRFSRARWEELVTDAAAKALEICRCAPDLRDNRDRALQRWRQQKASDRAIRDGRRSLVSNLERDERRRTTESDATGLEALLDEALDAALEAPVVRIDSMLAIMLSNHRPELS